MALPPRERDGRLGMRSRLFLVASDGKLIARRPGVWSAQANACVECGTTEKRHMARGRCACCYAKFKRRNDEEFRLRDRLRSKAKSLASDYQQRYDEARKNDPKRREQRRAICRRWADKNCKWPIGCSVSYEIAPGLDPVVGTIVSKTRTLATVQFKTMVMELSYRRLRRVG